jgi:hypothetical protein
MEERARLRLGKQERQRKEKQAWRESAMRAAGAPLTVASSIWPFGRLERTPHD